MLSNVLWALSSTGHLDFGFNITVEHENWHLQIKQKPAGPVAFFNQTTQAIALSFGFSAVANNTPATAFSASLSAHIGLSASLSSNGSAPNTTYDLIFSLTNLTRIDSYDGNCTAMCKYFINDFNTFAPVFVKFLDKVLAVSPVIIPNFGGELTRYYVL